MRPAAQQAAWYQNVDFVAARNKVVPPNGITAYIVPRPVVNHAFDTVPDVTAFHYGQREWSRNNMPNILYVLDAPGDWKTFKRCRLPPQKRDAQGNMMFEQWPVHNTPPRALLDFEVLPDQIGTRENWFIIEAWRRLDPRIRWQDIHMRMYNQERPNEANLRSKRSRPRDGYHMISWFSDPNSGANTRVRNGLTAAQRAANTTRGATPGLIDPRNPAAGRVPHPGEGSTNDQASDNGEEDNEDDSEDDSHQEGGPNRDQDADQDSDQDVDEEDDVEGEDDATDPCGSEADDDSEHGRSLSDDDPRMAGNASDTQDSEEQTGGAHSARDGTGGSEPPHRVDTQSSDSSSEYQELSEGEHWSGWRFNVQNSQ